MRTLVYILPAIIVVTLLVLAFPALVDLAVGMVIVFAVVSLACVLGIITMNTVVSICDGSLTFECVFG